ncbi:MAG TPA: polysaccharide deacetylase family protein [Polyangiaceae bacterium]|nr:polysaccharide deacetylase family protein [Polyangiaceae bacterium]
MEHVAVSIDLDELHLYRMIHGLPFGDEAAGRVVHEVALPRALAWAEEHCVRLTLFVVARDLDVPASAARLREAIARGHTVESHSLTHPYDLARADDATLDREIGGSFDVIASKLGERPRGFRAPGYTTSARLLAAVARAGAAFDASALPSPAYVVAKRLVMGALSVAGRPSRASPGSLRDAVRSRAPHRPRAAPSLVALPIATTRMLRIPIIGTSLGWAGRRGAAALVRAATHLPVLDLELHGIDFLDASEVPADLRSLPELGRPLGARLAAFDAAIETALRSRRPVTLREAAERFRAV